MTKLIAIFFIALVGFVGCKVFQHYEAIKNQEETVQKQEAAAIVRGDQLDGLPQGLSAGLQAAEEQGTAAVRTWYKTYGHLVQDPRKAWIELDIAVQMVREDPSEARRIFAAVKERTPPGSPVLPRIKQLQATLE
jgi:hypothetical protein